MDKSPILKQAERGTDMKSKSKKLGSGLTMVELLIALAITTVLLTAVAVAFNASITNYQQNQDIFKTINTARQALFRITTHLRTASAVQTTEASNQCSLITSDSQDITYRYNSSNDKLYLVTNDDLTDSDYVLCDNVTAMTFTKNTDVDDDGVTYVKSVQLSMTVQSGNLTRDVSAAAVVRRNIQ
jgi:Tfp pilus assembly protein PilW